MFTISIDPIIFNIGHFAVRWYGIILTIAMGIGIWLTAREAERKGFKKDDVYDAAVWIIVGGLLGARLFHVLDHWSDEYAVNPIRALYIWEGGLAIWGALLIKRERSGRRFLRLFAVLFMAVTGIHMLTHTMLRFRLPYVEPYLSILAGPGMLSLLATMRKAGHRVSACRINAP